MADFIGVQSGDGATGYLNVNGNIYPATSGGNGGQYVPAGNYNYGANEPLAGHQWWTMSDRNRKTEKNFSKFHIGTAKDGGGEIWDASLGRYRKGVEFHFDGGNPGTEGCIGYQDPAAKDALIADPNKQVSVTYANSMEDVQHQMEAKVGHKIDWTKVKSPKAPVSRGPGPQSTTTKKKKVKVGDATTLSGTSHRETAHLDSELEGGGKIVMASTTVFVGKDRKGVARVTDATTDGPVDTGDSSILVG
jgi:hypothetical protein